MPIELLGGLQLALYGIGWALAAWLIVEERPALLHWTAYAALQVLSVAVSVPIMALGHPPPWHGLLLSAFGFAAAMRGLEFFVTGQAGFDRWAMRILLPMTAAIIALDLALPDDPQRTRWEGMTYSLGVGVLLLAYIGRVWRPLRQTTSRMTALIVLAPLWSTALMALVSLWARARLDDAGLHQVQAAARMPNMVMMLVMSAIFNLAFLFLLIARLLGRLRDAARIDHLTGVLNRRATEEALASAWERHRRHRGGLAVVMVDVDHFKALNDVHGHARGDQALTEVAATLREHLRPYDIVGRWGGEEFLMILPDEDASDAAQSCERLRPLVTERIRERLGLALSISIGVSAARTEDDVPQAIIQRADHALYEAKGAGRDCVRVSP